MAPWMTLLLACLGRLGVFDSLAVPVVGRSEGSVGASNGSGAKAVVLHPFCGSWNQAWVSVACLGIWNLELGREGWMITIVFGHALRTEGLQRVF